MFQRLKGAIDSRIAEEQARQRQPQVSPAPAENASRGSPSRTNSPHKRATQSAARSRQDGDLPAKGSDPADFEPDFALGDDELSRSGTPKPATDRERAPVTESKDGPRTRVSDPGQEPQDAAAVEEVQKAAPELPTDVRVKLRKLEKLETRYQELLRSYRIAHARVLSIEPFETSLRENTPLTSISDPNALVEYLNQLNLKGDMVLDELKRVSNERDTFKQKLSEAEKSTREGWDEVAQLRKERDSPDKAQMTKEQENVQQSDNEAEQRHSVHGDSLGETPKSPTASIKSPTLSLPGMSLFSPKSKDLESPKARQSSEDLFSYDGEIPRLESELQEKDVKIHNLETEVTNLKTDLAVTRESTQSMVQTLEEATREASAMRESKDRSEMEAKEQQISSQKLSEDLRAELQAAEVKLQKLNSSEPPQETEKVEELTRHLQEVRQELGDLQSTNTNLQHKASHVGNLERNVVRLEEEYSVIRKDIQQHEKRAETLNSLIANLRSQLSKAEAGNEELTIEMERSSKTNDNLQQQINGIESKHQAAYHALQSRSQDVPSPQPSQSVNTEAGVTPDVTSVGKKKNKKKKKAGKPGPEHEKDQNKSKEGARAGIEPSAEPADAEIIEKLQQDLKYWENLLEEKDTVIGKLEAKMKNQEDLREEIDLLRDNLVNVGQEHVETKDRVKELTTEKAALEETVAGLERDIAELRGTHASTTAGSEQRHSDLAAQFRDLKVKATTLQSDLSAAEQLASSRFKDLNDLRGVLQKAQPEINALRSEAAAMKSTKDALTKKEAEFKRLDLRCDEMRSEVARLKQTIAIRETEMKALRQTISQETSSRSKAEEASSKAQQDMHRMEAETKQAMESLDRISKELNKSRDELASQKMRLKEVEQQFSKHRSESEGLKEEVDLKTAQYASAQSLMASMRDQTAEMGIQMKEARDRCESLDEEVADAHRLLSERSREAETMRRLLADVEGRADTRIREMKERMDTAIEERDRAEEEASTVGRRRARELEDMRSKYHDLERSLKRAEDDKEELEMAQREWKKRREELEHQTGQSSREIDDVRKAMGELRDALDESERQARDLERQKAELRRSVEQTQHRVDKLQKSNKSMAEDMAKFQAARNRTLESDGRSSRSSLDSAARLTSPAAAGRTASAGLIDGSNGQPAGTSIDYVYLKNVLLQFLEQRDKKHQMQLIPVLGMLLHFDHKDEQKWMSAINTKG